MVDRFDPLIARTNARKIALEAIRVYRVRSDVTCVSFPFLFFFSCFSCESFRPVDFVGRRASRYIHVRTFIGTSISNANDDRHSRVWIELDP